MLRYTVIFLIIALIAGILGFGAVAIGAAAIAKIFFYIFVVLIYLFITIWKQDKKLRSYDQFSLSAL